MTGVSSSSMSASSRFIHFQLQKILPEFAKCHGADSLSPPPPQSSDPHPQAPRDFPGVTPGAQGAHETHATAVYSGPCLGALMFFVARKILPSRSAERNSLAASRVRQSGFPTMCAGTRRSPCLPPQGGGEAGCAGPCGCDPEARCPEGSRHLRVSD